MVADNHHDGFFVLRQRLQISHEVADGLVGVVGGGHIVGGLLRDRRWKRDGAQMVGQLERRMAGVCDKLHVDRLARLPHLAALNLLPALLEKRGVADALVGAECLGHLEVVVGDYGVGSEAACHRALIPCRHLVDG